ncbi:MAG TPA: DUF4260 domain-containing protein [Aquamicrobium sp.]|nr:DUF4260 domain-containing protein [Aquamicrobium sp.]
MIRLLRLENAALAALAIGLYWHGGASWWLFAALILAPDIAFVGYLRGPKVGAFFYNAAHSWIGPVLAGAVGWVWQQPLAVSLALIWAAHIGIDRALGYGLKHQSGFSDTHLGRIGQGRAGG